jgi:Protein of unknown function (DUF1549)/Protein of unknown function (DUF1553)
MTDHAQLADNKLSSPEVSMPLNLFPLQLAFAAALVYAFFQSVTVQGAEATAAGATAVTNIPGSRVQAPAAAKEVDRLIYEEILQKAKSSPAKPVDDLTYLRRISLDVAGRLPTTAEITSFSLDTSTDRRVRAVERLLAENAYAENWGRYWRDVIMYRRSDDRALLAMQPLEEYLVEQFQKNTPWDQVATSFITATGDVRENGATAIIIAQMGETSDITAEVSRIFLGIQIQCAQCHDHATDRWLRTQFHELAAFFPRIGVRPKQGDVRSFEVVSVDRAPRIRRPNNGRPRGNAEHFMPDLDDPSAPGKRMEPVFFATGQKLGPGKTDLERRGTIARWITASENTWFAKAFVNRIWSELVGEGFYEPVDDMGPDRESSAPKTLDYLAAQFAANKYDVKWLFRTITATEAYARESRPRRSPEETPLVANAAQRLRGDQLFTAITSVLGTPVTPTRFAARQGGQGRYGVRNPRFLFNTVFGFDPSTRRDEVAGSIPQALAMMNSQQIATGLEGDRRGTMLAKLLNEEKNNDEAVVEELYLHTLSREPTRKEVATSLLHVKKTENRTEGFEDVLWALLNSAEFSHRK